MELMVNISGWIGTALFVLAYYLVSSGKLEATGSRYQWMNLIGAFCLGANVFYEKAWPALGLEIIWATIAIGALIGKGMAKTKN